MRRLLRGGCLGLVVVAGLGVAGGATGLVRDWFVARAALPGDQATLEALQERVLTDASVAPELEAERERQRDASLDREERGRALGWTLIVATVLLVAASKGYQSLGPETAVTRERIDADKAGHEPDDDTVHTGGRAVADDTDLTAVEEIVREHGRSQDAAIPIIQAIQGHYGYLPDAALERVCELTEITPAQVSGTSSFYANFRSTPMGAHLVRVCCGTACHVSGARQITEELHRHLAIPDGADTDTERCFTISPVACLGCCSLAPVLMVDERTVGKLTPASAVKTLDRMRPARGVST